MIELDLDLILNITMPRDKVTGLPLKQSFEMRRLTHCITIFNWNLLYQTRFLLLCHFELISSRSTLLSTYFFRSRQNRYHRGSIDLSSITV